MDLKSHLCRTHTHTFKVKSRDINYDSLILLHPKLKWNMSYAIRPNFQIMTQLLNHVDLTLVVKPFKNTYCSVYIHVDKVVQKTRHNANLQPPHFGPLQSTLCSMCLQVFLCEFGLILLLVWISKLNL